MDCQIEFSVMSEQLAGHVARGWKYEVEAKVFSKGLMASGIIAVDEHPLEPGPPRELSTATRSLLLPAQPGEGPATVQLSVNADRVRWPADDEPIVTVPIRCPEPGDPPYTIEADIPLTIDDAPDFFGGAAKFVVRARLVATRVQPTLQEQLA